MGQIERRALALWDVCTIGRAFCREGVRGSQAVAVTPS